MESTNSNLTNPTRVDKIDLSLHPEFMSKIVEITEGLFCNITKDPETLYAVTDPFGNTRMYLGEAYIEDYEEYPKYVLGPKEELGYPIIAVYKWRSLYWMRHIKSYHDPMCALNELNRLNNAGHGEHAPQILNFIKSALHGDISVHDMIISIFMELGYNDDTSLAALIAVVGDETYQWLQPKTGFRMLPPKLVADLPYLAYEHPTSMFPKYNAVYNVFVKNNVFWDRSIVRNLDEYDFSKIIEEVITAAMGS